MKIAVIKRKIKMFFRSLGIEITQTSKRGTERLPGYVEQEFKNLYQKYYSASMVPWSGLYSTYKAARYVIENNVQGDIVECGVWRGGCSAIMLETFKNAGMTDKVFYLYDTFEGMTAPTDEDTHFSGAQNAVTAYKNKSKRGEKWSFSNMDVTKEVVSKTGYPEENILFIKGDVKETLKQATPDKIALLRLDTDWYESTKVEMINLFPLLISQGILLIDDYGAWRGSYQAVNEYFEEQSIKMYLNIDTSYGGAAGVKL